MRPALSSRALLLSARRAATFAIFVAHFAPASAAEPALSRFAFEQPHMGTRFRIVLYAADEPAAAAAAKAAFARVAELDAIMSDYKADSELMKLCAKSGGPAVPVSDDLFSVLKTSLELAARSDGAFDVTVGPLTRIWRRTRRTQVLPAAEELAGARRRVGSEKVLLDEKARTVRLTVTGMQLDLGGIAKGHAADAALKALRERGITRAFVAAGGDIAVGEAPPNAAGWKIGIAPLEDPTRPPTKFLTLVNAAISTSGDAEQYVEIDGVRYSHILDPKTGLGLRGFNSVTVTAPNCTTTDGLATAVCVLGPARGLKLIEETAGAAALFVRKTDKGEEASESKRWRELKVSKE